MHRFNFNGQNHLMSPIVVVYIPWPIHLMVQCPSNSQIPIPRKEIPYLAQFLRRLAQLIEHPGQQTDRRTDKPENKTPSRHFTGDSEWQLVPTHIFPFRTKKERERRKEKIIRNEREFETWKWRIPLSYPATAPWKRSRELLALQWEGLFWGPMHNVIKTAIKKVFRYIYIY